jgi:hypothetical protein
MSAVVKVNGSIIDEQMIESALARYIVQLEEDDELDFKPTPENMKFLRAEVLNFLIERVLLLQLAEKKSIRISDSEVDKRVASLKANFKDDDEWLDNLIMLHINEDMLFDEIKNDMTMESLMDEIYSEDIDVSDDKLEAYYNDNERFMKEPDLFSFYEVFVGSTGLLKEVAGILESGDNVGKIRDKISSLDLEFNHYADVPAFKIPGEVLNVLSDMNEGAVGTMVIDENGMVVFKLLRRIVGKKLEFKDIKDNLAHHIIENGHKDIYSQVINKELDDADIEYINVAYLSGK